MRREYNSKDIINSGEAIIDIRDNRTAYGMIFNVNHQNTKKFDPMRAYGKIRPTACIRGAAKGGVTNIYFKDPDFGALHLYVPERDGREYNLLLRYPHRNIEIVCGSDYYDKGHDVSDPVEKRLL
jgi:hypothetical protein